jgi:hypothetical protein
MRIDTHHARLPLSIGEAAHLQDARDTRLTSLRGIAWVTIDGDRRDIVLEPGDSFVVDSDARVVVYPLRAGQALELAVDAAGAS